MFSDVAQRKSELHAADDDHLCYTLSCDVCRRVKRHRLMYFFIGIFLHILSSYGQFSMTYISPRCPTWSREGAVSEIFLDAKWVKSPKVHTVDCNS